MLSSATIIATHDLAPPAFGFESLFHYPAPTKAKAGTHEQHVVRVEGHAVRPFSDYYLRLDLLVRGALWRSQTTALCTVLNDNPEVELRRCQNGTGAFSAVLWSFVPSHRPGAKLHHSQASTFLSTHVHGREWRSLRSPSSTHAERLRVAAAVLARIDVCNLSYALPTELLSPVCNASDAAAQERRHVARAGKLTKLHARTDNSKPVSPDQLMSSSATWHSVAHSDLFAADWRTIGSMFALAALTNPQPFAIVESGNFCGGMSGYLAILKRILCPSCPYFSLDPGGYRKKRHVRFTCHRASLAWLGLAEDVTFVDEPSPARTGASARTPAIYAPACILADASMHAYSMHALALVHMHSHLHRMLRT